jgi:hypothetical protein
MRADRATPAVLIVAAGCWGHAEPKATVRHDPERARAALVAALDSWKRGDAKQLARRAPPIRFVDEDFQAGSVLADYGIVEPDAPILPYQDVHVILSLRDARGKAVRRETHYQVATDPALAVLRSD